MQTQTCSMIYIVQSCHSHDDGEAHTRVAAAACLPVHCCCLKACCCCCLRSGLPDSPHSPLTCTMVCMRRGGGGGPSSCAGDQVLLQEHGRCASSSRAAGAGLCKHTCLGMHACSQCADVCVLLVCVFSQQLKGVLVRILSKLLLLLL